jgi:hypothetical protein
VPADQKLSLANEAGISYRLTVGGKSYDIPEAVRPVADQANPSEFCVLADGERVFLVIRVESPGENAGESFDAIFCLDTKEKTTIWRTELSPPSSIPWSADYWELLDLSDDVVYLYGATAGGLTVEGFARDSGKRIVFVNCY